MTRHDDPYLVIGSGRMASHWRAYLDILGKPGLIWARATHDKDALNASLAIVKQVFLAISDDSLEAFYNEHLKNFAGPVYHFSGCHLSATMYTCHPLMTFGTSLYESEVYRSMTLVLESGDVDGAGLFSEFPNPVVSIPAESKPLYHALCVMSCNFPQIIWANTIRQFKELGIGAEALCPLLSATVENSLNLPGGSITGPLARKDQQTMEKNIQSLQSEQERELYRSFAKMMGCRI